jgi:hypothetical protein
VAVVEGAATLALHSCRAQKGPKAIPPALGEIDSKSPSLKRIEAVERLALSKAAHCCSKSICPRNRRDPIAQVAKISRVICDGSHDIGHWALPARERYGTGTDVGAEVVIQAGLESAFRCDPANRNYKERFKNRNPKTESRKKSEGEMLALVRRPVSWGFGFLSDFDWSDLGFPSGSFRPQFNHSATGSIWHTFSEIWLFAQFWSILVNFAQNGLKWHTLA